ncbi:hypothetical protein NTE_03262 [Candidatus Nitrososphaera evergladensis SR1]|jgi:uncharacterized protein YacL|uniref:Uncharacterized protein n=1 Tax=Candidatus Nitrososphaera evergladensis SR1 TaxID=1459636 RepID=A0A075MUF3_9ARCH|nr:hypothetical protein [Candidatus Nitrososphaera evergladensis]AIF85291.1 hypothetical protein NTE_03262 [Candidatus Nitrososphaera evergladensis SR1]
MPAAPVFVINPAFIQSLFDAQQQNSMLLNQIQMDDMSLIAVGLVIGLIIIVVVALMSMVGGLHVFD